MLRDQYGDIVKLDGIIGRRTTILLFSPELCEKMYRVEGMWPMRISMESMHHYRESRKNIYDGQYGLGTRLVARLGKEEFSFFTHDWLYLFTHPHVFILAVCYREI